MSIYGKRWGVGGQALQSGSMLSQKILDFRLSETSSGTLCIEEIVEEGEANLASMLAVHVTGPVHIY